MSVGWHRCLCRLLSGLLSTYGINVHVSMIARLFGGAARSVVVSIAGTIVALAA